LLQEFRRAGKFFFDALERDHPKLNFETGNSLSGGKGFAAFAPGKKNSGGGRKLEDPTVFTTMEINELVESGRSMELFPEQNAALKEIFDQCSQQWENKARETILKIHGKVGPITEDVLKPTLKIYEKVPIAKKLQGIISNFRDRLRSETEKRIDYIMKTNELHYTFNEHYLKENVEKNEKKLREEAKSATGINVDKFSYNVTSAIEAMAKAQAYYRVTLKYMVDSVMKTAYLEMITNLKKQVREEIESKLQVMTAPAEKLLLLMKTRDGRQEERRQMAKRTKERKERRQMAKRTKERMEKALKLIEKFENENNYI